MIGHTVSRFFSCSIVQIGTVPTSIVSNVGALGMRAYIDVSSMFAINAGSRLSESLCFLSNSTKLRDFSSKSRGTVCPLIVRLLRVKLNRLIKFCNQPRKATNLVKPFSSIICLAKT